MYRCTTTRYVLFDNLRGRMMKIVLILLGLVSVLPAQVFNNRQIVSTSGTPITVTNQSTATVAVIQEYVSGSPNSASVIISGCTSGGTCTTLDTQNLTNYYALRTLNLATSYSYYKMIPTWSGGTNVSVTLDTFIPIPKASSGTTTVVRPIGYAFPKGSVAGDTFYYSIPFACTIQGWTMTVDTGTAKVDVWKIAAGTAIPTITNTIVGSTMPAVTTGTAAQSAILTGWTTSVAANDIIAFNLNTVVSATKVSLVLSCQ